MTTKAVTCLRCQTPYELVRGDRELISLTSCPSCGYVGWMETPDIGDVPAARVERGFPARRWLRFAPIRAWALPAHMVGSPRSVDAVPDTPIGLS